MGWGFSFGVAHPHTSKGILSFVYQIKFWAAILACHFKSLLQWDRTKKSHTLPTHAFNQSVHLLFKLGAMWPCASQVLEPFLSLVHRSLLSLPSSGLPFTFMTVFSISFVPPCTPWPRFCPCPFIQIMLHPQVYMWLGTMLFNVSLSHL